MRSISLFAEDFGHEAVLVPMIDCLAARYEVKAKVRPISVRGGFGKVAAELKEYVQALLKYRESLPDLVVVATDANCEGFRSRRDGLRETAQPIEDRVVYAVPDPHVERWLLRDPAAFKSVLATPCKIPDQKCDRDRYKSLLIQAIRAAGASPLIGGMEYADDIVRQMDLGPTTKDDDFCAFLQDLHARFRLWTQGSAR